eukprot:8462691-Pyramimonas_sp.AAC.1
MRYGSSPTQTRPNLHRMNKFKTKRASLDTAIQMMDAGVVELAMRSAASYHDHPEVLPVAFELLARIAWCFTDPHDLAHMPELARRIKLKTVSDRNA